MNQQQAQRLAENEALFRTVNEKMIDLNEAFERIVEESVFVCECSRINCVEQVTLKLAEYEAIRKNPRRFVIAPSEQHVVQEIERVVEQHERYFVVEKLGQAAEEAERLAAH